MSPRCAPEQIEVVPGNRIPGVPLHNFKLSVLSRPADRWTVGASMIAHSSQYARGNENNAHRADGPDFTGCGKLGGYALLDVYANYEPGNRWELFAKITNALDKRYASAGQLGRNAFDPQGRFIADANEWRNEQSVGPGAPRAGWIGVRYRMRTR